MADQNTVPNKTRPEIEGISEKIKASKLSLKDFVVPFSVFLILILLLVFLFVPMIKTALSYREEYKQVKEKQERLEELEEELRAIDGTTLQEDLVSSKQVIPQSLRVSSFMFYIDNLAKEKNLYAQSLSAGDSQRSAVNKEEDGGEARTYYGVSSPLSYEGTLEDILSFLDSLYEASPYVISAEGVSLRSSSEDTWRVTLRVTGYYVSEITVAEDPFSSFQSYTDYQDIVEIFREKAAQLQL